MSTCPKCGAGLENDNASFCSECGAKFDLGERVTLCGPPGGQAGQSLDALDALDVSQPVARDESAARAKYGRAVQEALADGVLDSFDRRRLEEARDDLRLSEQEAAQVKSRTIEEMTGGASPPAWTEGGPAIAIEINDNHFYMEKHVGVLDLQVTNLLDRPVANLQLGIQGNNLGSHRWTAKLAARGSARHKFEVVPSIAGEHLLNITGSYDLDGAPAVWVAQPTLRILEKNENPSNLTVVFDQHMEAARNLGYGLSIRNEVKEGFAKGVFRDANDLLKQHFSDRWQAIALSYDEELSQQAARREPREVEVVSTADGGEAIDRLSLDLGKRPDNQRILLLGKASVSLGRRREENEIVLRKLPRSKEADNLTLQISGQHATLALRPKGLFVIDRQTVNGTSLNGKAVKGEAMVPLDQPSELDIGKAFRLRLIPFLEAQDGPTIGAARYARLGRPDSDWLAAEKLRLRSLFIQRSDNLGESEKYVVVFRWIDLGHGSGNEIVLPNACSARRCMRIIRIGGRFWLENLSDEDCVSAGHVALPKGHACPLSRGMQLGCDEVSLRAADYRQHGL
jgi:pSer/pThr/pTyr-binding forkhead associated (FHA) protein